MFRIDSCAKGGSPLKRPMKIIGTARVLRSSGTSTKSFRVQVNEWAEPGAMDTFSFGVLTSSYPKRPSFLIGRNPQIHR